MKNERVTYIKGEYVPDSEAKIDYYDGGFQYGIVVTDAIRTFNYKPFKVDRHIDRLMRSLKVARIDPGMSRDELKGIALTLLEKNRHCFNPPHDDTWIFYNISSGRYFVYSEPGKTYPRQTVCVNLWPLEFRRHAKFYLTGCHVVTPSIRQMPPQCLDPKLKHRSRLSWVLAGHEAHEMDPEGFALALDLNGNVTETAGANFFIVKDGVLRTPPTDVTLAGISRETVLELAQQIGIPAEEKHFQIYDVYNAEEAFLTTTSFCILPTTKANGLTIGDGKPGKIALQLLNAWSETVGVNIVDQALRAAGLL
ncbi:MAG: aminotransferase class IV [Chloroflexi bacterium]|nr:aminotransferase class IV [Chloroflexota bacterium]